jgi:hypothetical protein
MKKYLVFNSDFVQIGYVLADTADAALGYAKRKWPFVWGLMVEEAPHEG